MNAKLNLLNRKSNWPLLNLSRAWRIEKNRRIVPLTSEVLCEQLFLALGQKIPHLQIKHNDHWSLISSNELVLAWITENRIWGSIKIWFIGDSQNAGKFPASKIKLRVTLISSIWGDCRGSFRISENAQISQAAELLHAVFYPALIEQKILNARTKSAKVEPEYVSI